MQLLQQKPTNKREIKTKDNKTITLNVPSFDLTPNDFETIDDDVLIQYLDNNERQINEMLNQNKENHAIHRGGSRGRPGSPDTPLTTKNETPEPKFYKIEAPEEQF